MVDCETQTYTLKYSFEPDKVCNYLHLQLNKVIKYTCQEVLFGLVVIVLPACIAILLTCFYCILFISATEPSVHKWRNKN